MKDLYEEKNIKPMLIGQAGREFDSPDYIFELKLDGERCLAFLDPEKETDLRNKRNMKMLPKVPELTIINRQVKTRCILDGELTVIVNGMPDFFEIQRRSLTSNRFRIRLMSQRFPAVFIAYDILYADDRQVMSLPLMERKKLLSEAVTENDSLVLSRYLEKKGREFFSLTKQMGLEGIVAKKKDSLYIPGKRTREWIKIKNLQDDDFVICGYIPKDNSFVSVVLGQYEGEKLVYMGHVTLGVSNCDYRTMKQAERFDFSPFDPIPPGNAGVVWLKPELVCKVKYMMKTSSGSMRQPVFSGIRFDKEPEECVFQKE